MLEVTADRYEQARDSSRSPRPSLDRLADLPLRLSRILQW